MNRRPNKHTNGVSQQINKQKNEYDFSETHLSLLSVNDCIKHSSYYYAFIQSRISTVSCYRKVRQYCKQFIKAHFTITETKAMSAKGSHRIHKRD